MGRPRKPAALRRFEGNPSKSRIPDELQGIGAPVPPARLTPLELERWHDVVRSLPDNVLTSADVSMIERMAVAWALFIATTAAINGELLVKGQHGLARNPLFLIRKQATEEMTACAMHLGLSPYARTRLTAQAETTPDVLTQLANGFSQASTSQERIGASHPARS